MTYEDLINEILIAQATDSPCVVVRSDNNGEESRTSVFSAMSKIHEVIGLLRYAEHLVKNTERI